MGDASLPPPQVHLQRNDLDERTYPAVDSVHEVNILVTGFGSFKSFTTNPSYLIASSLSRSLDPKSESASTALKHVFQGPQHPIREPSSRPYKVNVVVYPDPIRVAYDVVRDLIPKLVTDTAIEAPSPPPPEFFKPEGGFDYVLHIGMAAGRENYTMETIAHRDHYKLKDVDDLDGSRGEAQWRAAGLPEVLDVGWNKEDFLLRWEALTRQREDEHELEEMTKAGWKEGTMTLVATARLRGQVFLGRGRRAAVKLSRDAGRYLCEFIFYTSLATRWREARDASAAAPATPTNISSEAQPEPSREKVGKVAFLHVPGGTEKHDIARGVRVAESAILAFVTSWEDGYRNPDVYGGGKERAAATANPGTPASMYEAKGTGDR